MPGSGIIGRQLRTEPLRKETAPKKEALPKTDYAVPGGKVVDGKLRTEPPKKETPPKTDYAVPGSKVVDGKLHTEASKKETPSKTDYAVPGGKVIGGKLHTETHREAPSTGASKKEPASRPQSQRQEKDGSAEKMKAAPVASCQSPVGSSAPSPAQASQPAASHADKKPPSRFWRFLRIMFGLFSAAVVIRFLANASAEELSSNWAPCLVWVIISFLCLKKRKKS